VTPRRTRSPFPLLGAGTGTAAETIVPGTGTAVPGTGTSQRERTVVTHWVMKGQDDDRTVCGQVGSVVVSRAKQATCEVCTGKRASEVAVVAVQVGDEWFALSDPIDPAKWWPNGRVSKATQLVQAVILANTADVDVDPVGMPNGHESSDRWRVR
jgi:hypothetical protein